MADGFEAGADIVTGGLIGRAVEPHAGASSGTDTHAHPADCLNCGTGLIGAHCHNCGQSAHVHRTAGAILHDIAHGVFHFESKAWHTLPMLIRQPGELTRRYVDGERARFVSPLAMFLFTVFLMFAIVANLPGWSFGEPNFLKPGLNGGIADARAKLTQERTRADAEVAKIAKSLGRERAAASPDAEDIARLEQRLAKATESRRQLAQAEGILPDATTFDIEGAPAADGDNWLQAKVRHARENPTLLLYKLKTSAYKFSWALIPLSIPFLWLLFPFSRRFGLYDHAVFTTYSLTFMSLLTITLALLGTLGVSAGILFAAAVLIPPFHIYKQMKGTYRLGRTGALVRTALLVTLIVGGVVPCFTLLLLYLGLA